MPDRHLGRSGGRGRPDPIAVNLKPGDRMGGSVPKFVQGLYLDTHVFGAAYADVGLGAGFSCSTMEPGVDGLWSCPP